MTPDPRYTQVEIVEFDPNTRGSNVRMLGHAAVHFPLLGFTIWHLAIKENRGGVTVYLPNHPVYHHGIPQMRADGRYEKIPSISLPDYATLLAFRAAVVAELKLSHPEAFLNLPSTPIPAAVHQGALANV